MKSVVQPCVRSDGPNAILPVRTGDTSPTNCNITRQASRRFIIATRTPQKGNYTNRLNANVQRNKKVKTTRYDVCITLATRFHFPVPGTLSISLKRYITNETVMEIARFVTSDVFRQQRTVLQGAAINGHFPKATVRPLDERVDNRAGGRRVASLAGRANAHAGETTSGDGGTVTCIA